MNELELIKTIGNLEHALALMLMRRDSSPTSSVIVKAMTDALTALREAREAS